MPPVFSVIVPAYNAERHVAETIESIRQQTFGDWELIVVDDGSTDGTPALLDSLAADDHRIRIVHQENRGEAGARRTGFGHATGEWVYPLDADDLAAPDALERFAKTAGRCDDAGRSDDTGPSDDTVVLFGTVRTLRADGSPFGEPRPSFRGTRADLDDLLFHNFMSVGAGVIRRRALEQVGDIPPLAIGADLALWVRLALLGPFQRVPGPPVMGYRLHGSNVSHRVLDSPEVYFAANRVIFDDPRVRQRLAPRRLARLERRRQAASHRFLAEQALGQGDFSAARRQLRRAIRVEPGNWRILALGVFAHLGWLPPVVARSISQPGNGSASS